MGFLGVLASLTAPLAYVIVLFGGLSLFSKIYRRRAAASATYEPWYPPHHDRDIYVSLLSLEPPPQLPILVAALLRRAVFDVKLMWQNRETKQALNQLLLKGQIGDELWNRFLVAEKELELELVEVVEEANTLKEGWGQVIFGLANEMAMHEKQKEIYEQIPSLRAQEKARLEESLISAPKELQISGAVPLGAYKPVSPSARQIALNAQAMQAMQQQQQAMQQAQMQAMQAAQGKATPGQGPLLQVGPAPPVTNGTANGKAVKIGALTNGSLAPPPATGSRATSSNGDGDEDSDEDSPEEKPSGQPRNAASMAAKKARNKKKKAAKAKKAK
ncbi:uncharacterized protein L969DRAFT_97401 [Mixia osmundae IAM 14324]|uniref:Translocation protein SEC66 n=1 Tax=Mixia osmundae (strain CBS 9802 / IAM 14324 / JCM 22182 / KY 12970) TaxID=764103 RepID=G7DUL6_MIXOS|nr:uncharacterized protein L969DRAFT_97401 [Mixia osmundae IAM 14324]KEI36390.1 hypothetical protein L969DRAFT_97401 [Mixia osmundae IAM 14324]GAA94276.1 hypothetical protein E5Q_00925 [Mixia osmundae IAM 14324]